MYHWPGERHVCAAAAQAASGVTVKIGIKSFNAKDSKEYQGIDPMNRILFPVLRVPFVTVVPCVLGLFTR